TPGWKMDAHGPLLTRAEDSSRDASRPDLGRLRVTLRLRRMVPAPRWARSGSPLSGRASSKSNERIGPGQHAAFDQMHELTVDLRERSYPIQVGTGLLADSPSLLALARGRSVAVVSDATVDGLLGDRLESLLRPAAHQLLRITLEPGEGTKSWRSLDR